jgi:adenylate cyclase
MAVFDSPEQAVEAALACRAAAEGVEVGGHVARIRAGVHVGRPRSLGGDYLGVDVNIAARVAQAAGPGEVLISDVVRERLGDGVSVRRKWRFSGKGTPAGMKAFSVRD